MPEGRYYVEVKAPGYRTTQTPILEKKTGTVINTNFELEKQFIPFLPDKTQEEDLKSPQNFLIPGQLHVGDKAPDFTLSDSANKDTTLSKLKGIKVLVTYLAPWSIPSREQFEILSQVHSEISKDTEFVGIFLQEFPGPSDTLMTKGNYLFPVVADTLGKTAREYNITLLPHHFLIDEKGIVTDIHSGVLNKDQLEELIK